MVFNRGLFIPEMEFWMDPWDPKPEAFISHAHADHYSRHDRALCSDVTAKLLEARFHMTPEQLDGRAFGEVIERGGFLLRMLPAGHIAGSAMLHVTRVSDGATLLYTGDFKIRKGRTTDAASFLAADLLIMETTFGLPGMIFPEAGEVDASILRFVGDALADGEVPVLFGYSLGKAQEAVALMAGAGIPVLSHPKVAAMTRACREAGLKLPEPVEFEGFHRAGHVVIAPPNVVASKMMRGLKKRRTAMLSGWALQPGSVYRYRVDEVIALSDHADHPGLLECVARVKPKRVLTVHGYSKEFAAELRESGIEAWCAMGGDQLELVLGRSDPGVTGRATPDIPRPGCQMADFSDVCETIGGTSSRLSKIATLVDYLRGLNDEEDLRIATRWLTGEALPRRGGRRTLNIGGAMIRHALLSVPGVAKDRYREISAAQNDAARTGRILLQGVAGEPEAMGIGDLDSFLRDMERAEGALEKVEMLTLKFTRTHARESETIIRLLTGDLRIGLKEGLVEEAVAGAFGAEGEEVRKANMLTGDLGMTAVLAKQGRLAEARLRVMIPVRCMLASPLDRNADDDRPKFGDLPFPAPVWLEPKYDGIRAQLHKEGDDVGLFSRDLRPLDGEFPELITAARALEGDFVLDGELIAYAEGRKLGFADLQRRLGRRKVEGDLFMDAKGGEGSVPLRYVAFDLLWSEGKDLLGRPLEERRRLLEGMSLGGMVTRIERFAADGAEEVEECFKWALRDGNEGLIAKDPLSVYSPGRRGKGWIKLKGVMPTLDCVVVFAEQGHGRRADLLSDYTFAVRDEESGGLRVLGKAYSGLTDVEIEELTEHFLRRSLGKEKRKHRVEPDVVLEIAFDAIQRSKRHDSGLALRFPRIKGIRRDKGPDEIDTLRTAEGLLKKA